MSRIIVVVKDGTVQGIFSTNENADVDVLNYDEMDKCDPENLNDGLFLVACEEFEHELESMMRVW